MTRPLSTLRSTQAQGFTLVEIMAALAILGTALFMLLQAHYTTLRLFETAREEALLTELLERAVSIARLEVAAGNPTGADELGKRYPDYEYRFEATPVDEAQPALVELYVQVEGPAEERDARLLIFQSSLR